MRARKCISRKTSANSQYLFARLEARAIQALVELDMDEAKKEAERRKSADRNATEERESIRSKFRAIFHIWPDFEISACINKSIATVKADAAQNSFSARGAGITWAVMDSGIQQPPALQASQATSTGLSAGIEISPSTAGAPTTTRTATGRTSRGSSPANGACAPGHAENKRPIAVSRYLKNGHRRHRIPGNAARQPSAAWRRSASS